MPLGLPTFVSNLFSSLKKASNPSEMDPSENSGEEPMEVEDLPLLTEVSETADTEGTYRVGEFCQPRIPMVKQTVKVETKAGLESKDDTGQRRGDVIDEVQVGSPEVPTSENLDEHEVAVDPLRGTAQPILDFLVEDETGVNVEVVEVADSEMPDEGDGNPDGGEQDERTLGAAADIEEREIGEESTIGLEDFADENESEPFVEITRRRVSQDGNCYCGKERNLNIAELLCASCNRWYHESCIGYQLGKLVPFMTNYVFICKNCSPTGLESFKRNQAQFSQMCVTALANLTQASVKEGRNRKIFSKDKDIIPFFDMHWEGMTTTTRRVTQSWHATVSKALQKEAGTIFTFEEALNDPDSPHFGLLSADLTQIRPNYDAMIKGGHLKVTELGVHQSSNSIFRGRGAKRRTVDSVVLSQASVAKKSMVVGHGYPVDHPYNKDGYRYILAEPDPNAPYRQEFDESSEWGGKPIPGWLYRVLNPISVLLALHDRAPQLRVSEDRLSVTGEKGYCMIRATHGEPTGY